MIYDTTALKNALPVGIICVAVNGHWSGDLYVKTGESIWASIPRSMRESEGTVKAYAEKMVSEKTNNVTPAPPNKLKLWFEESNVNKVLGMTAGTIERADRLQRLINEAAATMETAYEDSTMLFREVRK